MASVGPKYAGTAANSSQGGSPTPLAWTNPTNAQGDTTGTAATVAPGASGTPSQRLRLTNFGFTSGEVPDGNTITGIQIEVERTANSTNRGGWATNGVQVLKAGTEHANVGASTTNWTTTKTIDSWGGDGNLLGATLSPADVRNSGFGVSLIFIRNGNAVTGSVFRGRITVFHAAPNVNATLAVSGGGAASLGVRKGAQFVLSVSGGGSFTHTYDVAENSGEEHSGTLSVSGGGSAILGTTTNRSLAAGVTGGGSIGLGASGGHTASVSVSGGGSVTVQATSDRASAYSISGGGSTTLSTSGEHFVAFALSGGGSVSVHHSAATPGSASASFGVTGGGGVVVSTFTERLATFTVSGGGSVHIYGPLDARTPRPMVYWDGRHVGFRRRRRKR